MKHIAPPPGSYYLKSPEEEVIIVDSIQNLPENDAYYTDYILFIFCTEGKAQMEYDGMSIQIKKGEVFFGVPGSVLSDYMISPNFNCKILAIKPSEIITSREIHSRIINIMFYIKTNPVGGMTEQEQKIIIDYYHLLCSRIQATDHSYYYGILRSIIDAITLEVVGIIERNKVSETPTDSLRSDQIVQRFMKIVGESHGRERRVEHYARMLNITPKYLCVLVKNILGRKPTEIIEGATIKEIERQLRYSDKSVKEISNDLDFPNPSFFGKYFKQRSGMTPMSFRKKYRK